MKITICILALSLAVTTSGLGQVYSHTLPRGYENVDGGTYTFGNWSFTNANNSRWQFTYDWTQFVHKFPLAITQIAFRPNVDVNLIGGTYQNVTVTLATSLNQHNAVSGIFANNLGPDATVVFQGDVIIPAYTATGATPAPWLVTIPFNLGIFYYDPSRLGDIVIDITTAGGTAPGNGFTADGRFPSNAMSQNGHITDPNAAASNWTNLDAGPIVQVSYILGSAAHFDLTAVTGGSGQGDLFLQYQNIPGGTTEGYTLISATPWPGEFGTGPVFGVNPDPTLFTILTLPAGFGDPVHWLYPAGILFPDAPIALPNGTLSGLAGQVWDVVGVALGPGGATLGHTAPRRLAW